MVTSTKPKRATPKPTSGPTDFRRSAERLKQVSDLTRLRVLLLLGDGEQSVGALQGYGNDSVRNGPLPSRNLHMAREAEFAFSIETRTRRCLARGG